LLLCLWSVSFSVYAQSDKTQRQRQFESEIKTFEASDKKASHCKNPVLFVGSSSIRMWENLVEDFPKTNVINRGFGGSHIEDSIDFAERIVIPYKPRLILIYAGDNDIESGKSPVVVLEDFKKFVTKVRQNLPNIRIAFISIKPSIARWRLVDEVRKANQLIKDFIKTDRKLDYIDVFNPMLGKDGNPRTELYIEDNLHMSKEGYKLWRSLIAPYLK